MFFPRFLAANGQVISLLFVLFCYFSKAFRLFYFRYWKFEMKNIFCAVWTNIHDTSVLLTIDILAISESRVVFPSHRNETHTSYMIQEAHDPRDSSWFAYIIYRPMKHSFLREFYTRSFCEEVVETRKEKERKEIK